MKIILASASPRRKELLEAAGVQFEIVPSLANECADPRLPPDRYTAVLARQKAEDVAARREGIILGADTVVELDGEILGKPKSGEEAAATLRRMSGREHRVYTAFCVIYGTSLKKYAERVCMSRVTFNRLSDELIAEYVASGKPLDKAGSYGVQDGYDIVKKVEGSLPNVIGLPIEEVLNVLEEIEDEQAENCDRHRLC